MCGQFTLEVEENSVIEQLVFEVHKSYPQAKVATGTIRPTNTVPIVAKTAAKPEAVPMAWGFPKWQGKGVIINTRAETAFDKPMFRDSVVNRRCVVPSTGFYEWSHDDEKQKYLFCLPDESVLYMAGIYSLFDGVPRFSIVTTAANSSMIEIHNRMPVILTKNNANEWLKSADFAEELLAKSPPLLKREQVV